ncbi:5-oxoprolinase subunit PxpA [Aliiglaciecola litoralis]|uniref:5-oxoprolinase subunit PxpA n=1 Tax=Aliiglaciecola litoralis TaxID=582857 RepID=UPI0031DC17A8
MKLNCDLGEGFGTWQMPHDQDIMPHIDMANIACGYHAGDPSVLQSAIRWAKQCDVSIGAHPSYPDRQGFGRRHMAFTQQELIPMLHYQIAALEGMSKVQGKTLDYVKPHGALYNDMMRDMTLFESVVKAIADYSIDLPLVIQALPQTQPLQNIAKQYGIKLLFEAFADRRYRDDGQLLSRREPHAVLNLAETLQQVQGMINNGTVISQTGKRLTLSIDTVCVHGDSVHALDAVRQIRQLLPKVNSANAKQP